MLEEAPSPAVDAGLRRAMGEAALTLARAVGYVSAGTCEFLLDDRGAFTFLEMNTRLQVEHPVTELVTGRDLVADQLRIAAGEPLGFTQDDVRLDGHAIEVRLYAEDAENGFLPATGRIERLRWPAGDGIRVDAGVAEGDEVGGRFDPMLAKIIARGDDRAEALDRLTRALDATVVLGLTTNLRFLRWLVREPVVRDGQARTDTLDRIWPPDDWAQRARIPDAAWSAAAARCSRTARPRPRPTASASTPPRPLRLVSRRRGPHRPPRPGQRTDHARTSSAPATPSTWTWPAAASPFRLAPPPDVDRAASAAAAASHGAGRTELVAPMPGQVLSIGAPAGSEVEAGDAVVTLEAMKMEHAVASPRAGHVTEVLVRVGDQVERGQPLAIVESA